MSLIRLFAQRIALGFIAIWVFLTGIFAVFTATPDWTLSRRIALQTFASGLSGDQIETIREDYLAARGLDRPLYEIYLDWMTNMLTLQWGHSFRTREEVFPTIMRATLETGTYVVPAIILALLIGLLIGVYSAIYRGSTHEGLFRSVSYLGLGFPHFWIGMVILTLAGISAGFSRLSTTLEPVEMPFVYSTLVPSLLLTLALSAAIVSYVRSYSLQYLSADLTKMVRAKGGSNLDVTRHVVRNAAIPLVSLMFTETLALLAISVFVIEALFGIDGLGLVIYNAIWARDLPMLLGATLVVVTIGVASNILQDIAYSTLDPRVDTGSRSALT